MYIGNCYLAQTKRGPRERQQHRKLYFTHTGNFMYMGNYYLPQTKRGRRARQPLPDRGIPLAEAVV